MLLSFFFINKNPLFLGISLTTTSFPFPPPSHAPAQLLHTTQDGSSIIDTNFAVGTIFGIWPGSRLTGITGRELAASGIAVYGPRTTISLAVNGIEGAHEFLLVDDFTARHGQWVKTNTFTSVGCVRACGRGGGVVVVMDAAIHTHSAASPVISPLIHLTHTPAFIIITGSEGKLFAPGNLRAIEDNPGYASLHQYWLKNKYQVRSSLPPLFLLCQLGCLRCVPPSGLGGGD